MVSLAHNFKVCAFIMSEMELVFGAYARDANPPYAVIDFRAIFSSNLANEKRGM